MPGLQDDLLVLGVSVKDMDKISHYYGCFIAYMEGYGGRSIRWERAIIWNFDEPQMAYEAYRQNTENLKSYMQRQRSLVGGMAGTFREME